MTREVLSCTGFDGPCTDPVGYIDRKGYIYCERHGLRRRASGTPCRPLLKHELATLSEGGTMSWAAARTETLQAGRREALLSRREDHGDGLGPLTRREWLERMRDAGGFATTANVPAVTFNRSAFNRMSNGEQAAYDRRCAETKVEHRIHRPGDVFWPVTKTEYDYFLSIGGREGGS